MLGPLTFKLPPAAIPAIGSSLTSIPGIILPTVPGLLNNGVLTAKTGAVSVVP